MSTGDAVVVFAPLYQGFLKKRKDKMRMRWVTYWFKLHNTTLFFYTKKHGTTADLRGQYYLFEVESVHEVMRSENKRYLFEITMKNGKRKVLAADTADLRQEWICQLLKAMKHPVANIAEPHSDWNATSVPKWRALSNPCSTTSSCSSHTQHSSSTLDRRHYSIMLNSQHHSIPSIGSKPVSPQASPDSSPDATPRNSQVPDTASFESNHQLEREIKYKTQQENNYDTLPSRKAWNLEEVIYDTPPSNRRVSGQDHEMTDTIYDVPKSVIRNTPEHVSEVFYSEERPVSGDLLSDMIAYLGENSADWIRGASPDTICKPQP